ncbi:MAG: four helix bundle protein [Bacilli bacterium]|nr:four helix bundle protein [Bacilli bacterium]
MSSKEEKRKETTREKNDRLLIAVRLKKTIIYIENILENFPHKYIEIKSHISNSLYEMLEYVYLANSGYDKERNRNLSIIKLQMVDFYLMLSYKKNLIGKKKFEGIIKHLEEIYKMLYGWKNYNEEI